MQRTHGRQGSSDVVTDLVKGAIAGAVAVWAMGRAGWWMGTGKILPRCGRSGRRVSRGWTPRT